MSRRSFAGFLSFRRFGGRAYKGDQIVFDKTHFADNTNKNWFLDDGSFWKGVEQLSLANWFESVPDYSAFTQNSSNTGAITTGAIGIADQDTVLNGVYKLVCTQAGDDTGARFKLESPGLESGFPENVTPARATVATGIQAGAVTGTHTANHLTMSALAVTTNVVVGDEWEITVYKGSWRWVKVGHSIYAKKTALAIHGFSPGIVGDIHWGLIVDGSVPALPATGGVDGILTRNQSSLLDEHSVTLSSGSSATAPIIVANDVPTSDLGEYDNAILFSVSVGGEHGNNYWITLEELENLPANDAFDIGRAKFIYESDDTSYSLRLFKKTNGDLSVHKRGGSGSTVFEITATYFYWTETYERVALAIHDIIDAGWEDEGYLSGINILGPVRKRTETDTAPAAPTGGTVSATAITAAPDGWTTDELKATAEEHFVWASYCLHRSDNSKTWLHPILEAQSTALRQTVAQIVDQTNQILVSGDTNLVASVPTTGGLDERFLIKARVNQTPEGAYNDVWVDRETVNGWTKNDTPATATKLRILDDDGLQLDLYINASDQFRVFCASNTNSRNYDLTAKNYRIVEGMDRISEAIRAAVGPTGTTIIKATNADIDAETDDVRYTTTAKVFRAIARKVKAATTSISGISTRATNTLVDAETDDASHMTVAKTFRAIARKVKNASTSITGIVTIARNEDVDSTETDTSRVPDVEKAKRLIDRLTGGQVTSAEKTAGTATTVRKFSPKDVHDMIDTHAPTGTSTEVKTKVGTADPTMADTAVGEDTLYFKRGDVAGRGWEIWFSWATVNSFAMLDIGEDFSEFERSGGFKRTQSDLYTGLSSSISSGASIRLEIHPPAAIAGADEDYVTFTFVSGDHTYIRRIEPSRVAALTSRSNWAFSEAIRLLNSVPSSLGHNVSIDLWRGSDGTLLLHSVTQAAFNSIKVEREAITVFSDRIREVIKALAAKAESEKPPVFDTDAGEFLVDETRTFAANAIYDLGVTAPTTADTSVIDDFLEVVRTPNGSFQPNTTRIPVKDFVALTRTNAYSTANGIFIGGSLYLGRRTDNNFSLHSQGIAVDHISIRRVKLRPFHSRMQEAVKRLTGTPDKAGNDDVDGESEDTKFVTVAKTFRAIARKVKAASTTVAGIVTLARNEDVDETETDTSRALDVAKGKRLIERIVPSWARTDNAPVGPILLKTEVPIATKENIGLMPDTGVVLIASVNIPTVIAEHFDDRIRIRAGIHGQALTETWATIPEIGALTSTDLYTEANSILAFTGSGTSIRLRRLATGNLVAFRIGGTGTVNIDALLERHYFTESRDRVQEALQDATNTVGIDDLLSKKLPPVDGQFGVYTRISANLSAPTDLLTGRLQFYRSSAIGGTDGSDRQFLETWNDILGSAASGLGTIIRGSQRRFMLVHKTEARNKNLTPFFHQLGHTYWTYPVQFLVFANHNQWVLFSGNLIGNSEAVAANHTNFYLERVIDFDLSGTTRASYIPATLQIKWGFQGDNDTALAQRVPHTRYRLGGSNQPALPTLADWDGSAFSTGNANLTTEAPPAQDESTSTHLWIFTAISTRTAGFAGTWSTTGWSARRATDPDSTTFSAQWSNDTSGNSQASGPWYNRAQDAGSSGTIRFRLDNNDWFYASYGPASTPPELQIQYSATESGTFTDTVRTTGYFQFKLSTETTWAGPFRIDGQDAVTIPTLEVQYSATEGGTYTSTVLTEGFYQFRYNNGPWIGPAEIGATAIPPLTPTNNIPPWQELFDIEIDGDENAQLSSHRTVHEFDDVAIRVFMKDENGLNVCEDEVYRRSAWMPTGNLQTDENAYPLSGHLRIFYDRKFGLSVDKEFSPSTAADAVAASDQISFSLNLLHDVGITGFKYCKIRDHSGRDGRVEVRFR